MRSFVVAANWKMHKSPSETVEYLKSFLNKMNKVSLTTSLDHEVAITFGGPGESQKYLDKKVIFFVPAVDAFVASEALKGSAIEWGAQNCYHEQSGAYTGENSAAVMAELGAGYVLVGHSERRSIFRETDEDTGKKLRLIQELNLTPMLCVGESLEEREKGITSEVIIRQLRAGLESRIPHKAVMIAYEPVWAIGTGKVATPEQANEAHQILRAALFEIGGDNQADKTHFAQSTPILYGGSVKPENARALSHQPEIDGFLVGGASLDLSSFMALCQVERE